MKEPGTVTPEQHIAAVITHSDMPRNMKDCKGYLSGIHVVSNRIHLCIRAFKVPIQQNCKKKPKKPKPFIVTAAISGTASFPSPCKMLSALSATGAVPTPKGRVLDICFHEANQASFSSLLPQLINK